MSEENTEVLETPVVTQQPQDGGGGSAPPAADPPQPPAGGTAEPPAPKADGWKDKELARKHRLLQESRQAAEAEAKRARDLDAENARLRELVEAANRRAPAADPAAAPELVRHQPAHQPVRTMSEAERRAEIQREAAALNAQDTAERMMDAAAEKGSKAYGPQWDAALENLRTLGGFDGDTLMDILNTDDPSKVLFELGNDPGDGSGPKFSRVMSLPSARRRNELVKMAMPGAAAPAPKRISDAPAPVDPLTQGGSAQREKPFDLYDQNIQVGSFQNSAFEVMKADTVDNDDRWYQERQKQKANSKGRPWSPK